jgi:hypothetical protein
MDLPEKTQNPEEPTLSKESFPEEPILSDGFTPISDISLLPRARRRRAQRMLVPLAADERAALLDELARRAFPSFEFFLYAILSGVVLGAAYLLNAPALLLLGILLAPILTPWIGLTLAAVTGSWRFFFLTLGGLLVAGILVFVTGTLAGMTGRLWVNLPYYYARFHAQLWWPNLLVVSLGAALMAISFVRSEQKPILSSVLLAYGFFLPISAAGIGLGIGKDISGVALWPNGVLVFLVHLALATLVGGIVLLILRFKPMKPNGRILTVLIGILSLSALVVLTGLVTFIRDGISATRHMAPTPTILLPSPSAVVFKTLTPLPTTNPSATPSPTSLLQPTPAYAIITSPTGGGALLRAEPATGDVLQTLSNGLVVQVLPETAIVGNQTWVRVRALGDLEGWVLQSVLTSTTPTPPIPTTTNTPIP